MNKFPATLMLCVSFVFLSKTADVHPAGFNVINNGEWSNALIWDPVGGPPGAGDTARIGNYVNGNPMSYVVSLSSDTSVHELDLGQFVNTHGTLELNGNRLSADDLAFGASGGSGSIVHNGGRLDISSRLYLGNSTYQFVSEDRVDSLVVDRDSTAATAETSNIYGGVAVGTGSALQLNADLAVNRGVSVSGSFDVPATIDARGHSLTAPDIYIGRFGRQGQILNASQVTATRTLTVSNGTLLFNSVYAVEQELWADSGSAVTLSPDFSVPFLRVDEASSAIVSAEDNVTDYLGIFGAGSSVELGADLTVSSKLAIAGSTDIAAFLNASGRDITAKNIEFGRSGSLAAIQDIGSMRTETLSIAGGSSLLFSDGDDVVLSSMSIKDSSVAQVIQSASQTTGLTLEGDELAIEVGSALSLVFDSVAAGDLDWAFRWSNPAGGENRIATLNNLATNGLITWSAPWDVRFIDYGDGFTYVGVSANPVPEPAGLGFLALSAYFAHLAFRRKAARLNN
jgi:hypothetical protein